MVIFFNILSFNVSFSFTALSPFNAANDVLDMVDVLNTTKKEIIINEENLRNNIQSFRSIKSLASTRSMTSSNKYLFYVDNFYYK